MKKIDLKEYLDNQGIVVKSIESAMHEINGGCTIKIGCNTKGYFIQSYVSRCATSGIHSQVALDAAIKVFKKPGKYKVSGNTTGSVTFLG